MNFLRTGHFFGEINRTIHLNRITLTDTNTEQTQEHIGWHYHENAYFTFILHGELIESSQKEKYHCAVGNLLFHSSREPHFNFKPQGNTRCFHVEFEKNLFDDNDLRANVLQGIFSLENPDIKFLLYKIFRETKILDDVSPASIQILLFEIFGQMLKFRQTEQNTKPAWTKKLKEILHDDFAEKITLENLAGELNIHPVHLSRGFSKYFYCTIGEYVRKVRVEKSLSLMLNKNLSLTQIAFDCGFADQSHFLRSFKQITGISPSEYRKLLVS